MHALLIKRHLIRPRWWWSWMRLRKSRRWDSKETGCQETRSLGQCRETKSEAKDKENSLLKKQSNIFNNMKESSAPDTRSNTLKESEARTTKLREGWKDLGLGEDRSLCFEKVMIHSTNTLGPENGKGHLIESSSERCIKLSSEPRKSKMQRQRKRKVELRRFITTVKNGSYMKSS